MFKPVFRVRPLAACIALALCGAAVMPERAMARTAAQMQSAVTVSIAPQPLGDALNELARQANVPLNFAADAVANRTAPALSGRFRVTEAFEKLLAGSGLAARLEGEVVLVRAASQGQAAQPNELQSVVVTARRPSNDSVVVRRSTGGALFGESDVREIPFSVNIVGEAEIKNRQATTLSEILSTDPSIGFVYQDGGGMPFERLTIRGFTQGNQVVNGQLTGLDVIAIQAANVDRIEVLRGPAAFRYGFVNPGGVVNTVTKRPTSRPQTFMSLTGAAESQLGVQVDHSSHFDSDRKFGYRINALYSDGNTPIDTQSRRASLFALATDFKLTPNLTVYADVQYSDVQARGGNSVFPFFVNDPSGRAVAPIDPRRTIQPSWGQLSTPTLTSGLEIDYRINERWKLNSMSRWVDAKIGGYGGVTFYAPFQANGDYTLSNYGYENKYKGFSNVTFLQGTVVTGSVTHKPTAGVSYIDRSLDGSFPNNNNTVSITSNIFSPVSFPFVPAGPFSQGFSIKEKQTGIFLSNEMTIGKWRPLIGVRHSRLDFNATFNQVPDAVSRTTPMLALSYDLGERASVYASYAEGLENGGRAPVGTTNANSQLPPLVTKGYEIGVKTDLLGGLATLDAALFSAQKTSAFTDASNTFVQRGQQVHNGIEVMARGRFFKPLEISAGVTVIDAQLKDDPATAGNRAVNVPRVNAVFFGQYAVQSVPGLFFSGQVNYVGSREYNLPNNNTVPAYTLLGLGVRYDTKIAGRPSVLRLNVNNLTNEAYFRAIDTFGGTLGAPRTIRASVEFRL